MILKHSKDVPPGTYAGVPDGVQMRELITERDGAPNFSMRVFDIEPGKSTPFHTHAWEHEVFIVEGTGTVRTEGKETPFTKGDSVFVAPHELHCFTADPGTPVRMICCVPSKNQCKL
jgi:quercetin dioxygenase-like cupin family protein